MVVVLMRAMPYLIKHPSGVYYAQRKVDASVGCSVAYAAFGGESTKVVRVVVVRRGLSQVEALLIGVVTERVVDVLVVLGQAVLGVIAQGVGAVGGEVAVAVIGGADRADRGVLVQRVGGVVRGRRRRCGIIDPAIVGHSLAEALVGRVVAVAEAHAAGGRRRRRGRRAPAHPGRPVHRVVGVARGILHRRAARRRGGDDGGAAVAGFRQPAGEVVAIGHGRRGRGRGLAGEPVQRVVAEADGRPGARLARQDIAAGVVGEGLRAAERIGRGREPVEAVIGKARGMIVGVGEARELAVGRIGLLQQRAGLDRRIGSRGCRFMAS